MRNGFTIHISLSRTNLDLVINWMWGVRENVSNMILDFWLKQLGYCSILLRQSRGNNHEFSLKDM